MKNRMIQITMSLILIVAVVCSACSMSLEADNGLSVSGDAEAKTVTIALDGTVVRGVIADSGNATALGNWLTLAGGGNVTVTASGNTVTITCVSGSSGNGSGFSPLLLPGHLFVGNESGLAEDMQITGDGSVNSLGELAVSWADACQACDTANDADTVDGYHADSLLASVLTDSGWADVSGANLSVVGGNGIVTSGSGSTITLSAGISHVSILGSTVRNSNDMERTSTSVTYVKAKEIRLNASLSKVRVYCEVYRVGGSFGSGYYRVYVNGVAVGVEHSATTTYTGFVDDLIAGYVEGDLIQIYAKMSSSEPEYVAVRNMRLEYDDAINAIGGDTLVTVLPTSSDPTISVTNQDP